MPLCVSCIHGWLELPWPPLGRRALPLLHGEEMLRRLLLHAAACRTAALQRWALLLAAAHATAPTSGNEGGSPGCTLAALDLRYHDRPIALVPPYRSYIFEYSATMDFSMYAYFVRARPDTGCEADGVPPVAEPVEIGGTSTLTVYARSEETQETQAYVVTVSRLLGSETDLSLFRVEGGTMSPVFDPTVRSYEVKLGLGYDEIRVVYRLRDNEQRIRGTAEEEVPEGGWATTAPPEPRGGGNGTRANGTNASLAGGDRARARRLADGLVEVARPRRLDDLPGEVQHSEESVSFMLDVGFSRPVTLTVQCADATQANIGAYSLLVRRPSCTPEKPYFNPAKRACVNFCPSGFYKSSGMSRCAQCNTNCEECERLEACQMCTARTPDFEYLVQPDGSCQAFGNHIFQKYRWWCTGLGVCLLFLLLIGCAGICQACFASEPTRNKFSMYSDSDEETKPVLGPGRRGRGQEGATPAAASQQRAVGGRLGRY